LGWAGTLVPWGVCGVGVARTLGGVLGGWKGGGLGGMGWHGAVVVWFGVVSISLFVFVQGCVCGCLLVCG